MANYCFIDCFAILREGSEKAISISKARNAEELAMLLLAALKPLAADKSSVLVVCLRCICCVAAILRLCEKRN